MKSAREIAATAWHITVENKEKLFRLGFIPSFFWILVSSCYLIYQYEAFRNSAIFAETKNSGFILDMLSPIWALIGGSPLMIATTVLLTLIVLGGWFFAPMLCRAAIAHNVAQVWRGEDLQKGFSSAFFHFFPLFQTFLVKRTLAPVSFLTEFSFVARNLGLGFSRLLQPALIFFAALGMIILFFFSFTTQHIILRDDHMTPAMKSSFKMVVEFFVRVVKIWLIILLIELRVILNILLVLAIPLIIAGVTGIFANILSATAGVIVAGIIVLLLILLAAYLSGILFVFTEAIWTVAFLEFQKEKSLESNTEQ